MTMHLEGPWLTTTGKRKGKQKFRNAEEAKKARELDESWKRLLQRHNVEQEDRKKSRGLSSPALLQTPKTYVRNTGPKIPSLNGGRDMGPAVLAAPKVYTGTKVKGIATMHKSNAIPVFTDEEAVEISRMRR